MSPGTDARGGAERSLLGLLDGFDREVVEASAVVLGHGSMVAALRDRGVRTTALSLGFQGGASYGSLVARLGASAAALRSLGRAASAVREAIDLSEAQIVHTNGMRGHVLLPFIHRRGVTTVASIRELPRSRLEALAVRGALRSADSVIATSSYVSRQLRFACNVHVVDNPIGAPRLPGRLEARVDLGLPAHAFAVAMLAHFHWWKGHLDLLRAVEPLDDVWVILAGGDLYGSGSTAYRDEVLAFARSRGFAHRVLCVGAVDDVGPIYAAADAVAHCSVRPEPFGRTIVEAMLAETPVVASSAGAPGELVRHLRTGLLFSPGDSEALREHLVSLREHPELGKSLASAALADVADRFDPHGHAAQVLAIYESTRLSRHSFGASQSATREEVQVVESPQSAYARRADRNKKLHRWSSIGKELGPSVEGRLAQRAVRSLGVLSIGQRARAQALAAALGGIPDPRVVFDVGCGRGLNALLLAKWFPRARVIGIDVDPSALRSAGRCAAAAGLANLELELTEADRIELAGQADLVVCIDVLEHVVDDKRLARELLELVSPAGTLVVHVPLRDQHYLFPSVRRRTLQAICEGRDPHVREGYGEADLRRMFDRGFERFETRETLGGLASAIADLEALSALEHALLPRVVGVALLPLAGYSGGRWSKGLIAVGQGRGS